jgi:16S rRNA (cytosine1402-N4)-methyltransferase
VPTFDHTSVLLTEVITRLEPKPTGRYLDGTVGGAGHAAAILEASGPTGHLFGCDQDGAAVLAASARLESFEGRFEIRQMNFVELDTWLEKGTIDGAVLDLGVSSHQFDVADRGFSLRFDGPLDMRMDQRGPLTAADLVNDLGATELADLFYKFGGESGSRAVARAIVSERRLGEIKSTLQLAGLVERVLPRRGRTHPATKVFQALRIAVNDELGRLDRGLGVIWSLLRPGGRLAVITFHSDEARMVKLFGRSLALDYWVDGDADIPEFRRPKQAELKWVERKAVQPTRAEILRNSRSRSAQLRVMEKL